MKKAITANVITGYIGIGVMLFLLAFSGEVWAQNTNMHSTAWKVDTDFSIYHPDYIQLKRNIQWDNQYLQILKKNNPDNASVIKTISEVEPDLQKLNEEIAIIDHSEKQSFSKSQLNKMQKEESEIHHRLFKQ
jgi:hypothetical protein